MSDLITNNLATHQNAIQALQRTETPAACLTLTRTATLSITTAGTTITWQSEIRNNGFTWSGTTITMPTSGFYNLSIAFRASVASTVYTSLIVNTIAVSRMADSGANQNKLSVIAMRYFTAGDTLSILMDCVANFTLNLNAENVADESPIFHIVQLTGSQT
jgi:hypothetical protein